MTESLAAEYRASRWSRRASSPRRHRERADRGIVTEAARIMVDHKIGALPVVDDGGLAGIVTASDFVRALGALDKGV